MSENESRWAGPVMAGVAVLTLLAGCASSSMRGTDLCFAGATCVTVVVPPTLVPAGGVRRVAVVAGTGTGADALASLVKGRLGAVLVDGAPYYQLLPSTATSLDARFEVTSTIWQVGDSSVKQQRFKCLDKKCDKKQDYTVSCTVRRANVEVQLRLLGSRAEEIGRQQSSATVDDTLCQGDSGGLDAPAVVLSQAGEKALAPIEDALTVRTLRKRVRMMESEDGIEDSARRERFRTAVKFLEAGRMDRACPVFEELADIEVKSVSVFYNLGFCEQAGGNWRDAFKWYSKADANSSKPLDELAAALAETRPYAMQATTR